MQTSEQLSLLAFGGLDLGIAREVIASKATVDKLGNVIGYSFGIDKNKEIAERLDLKGKANRETLADAILARRDIAMGKIKSGIAGLGPDWTFKGAASREMKNGEIQMTIKLAKIKRRTGPSDESIAKTLGWTVEQVREARERQEAKLRGSVDVDSHVSQPPKELEAPKPDQTMTDEELDRATQPDSQTVTA